MSAREDNSTVKLDRIEIRTEEVIIEKDRWVRAQLE